MAGDRERYIVFHRYGNILARLNGLIIGAISVDMIMVLTDDRHFFPPYYAAPLIRGDIDVYPEYTGGGLVNIPRQEASPNPDESYPAVKRAFAGRPLLGNKAELPLIVYDEQWEKTWYASSRWMTNRASFRGFFMGRALPMVADYSCRGAGTN